MWRHPSRSWFKQFCHQLMDQCFFSRYPATHTFCHMLNALLLAYQILMADCSTENSVCFSLIGGSTSAPPKSKESLHTSPASYSLQEILGNGGKSAILATSVFRISTGSCNLSVGWLMEGVPGAPEGGFGQGGEIKDVSSLTGFVTSGPGSTLRLPGDESPCPGVRGRGNI